jgi:hypothetical protein
MWKNIVKKSYNKLLQERTGKQNNIRRREAVFSHFDHL